MVVYFVCFAASVAGVATSLRLLGRLPVWSIAILAISLRDLWTLAFGSPNDLQFVQPWIQSAPFVLPLVLIAAAEAYFRPSTHYKGSTRLALLAGGGLILTSTLLVLVVCLPPQALVQWQMPELKTLMITHQVIYASSALWLGMAWCIYRWMPVPWMPVGLLQHLSLLFAYTAIESIEVLILNSRLFLTPHLPLIMCIGYIMLFYCWLRIPLEAFSVTQPPPSTDAEIEAAKQAVKTVSRMVEKGQ